MGKRVIDAADGAGFLVNRCNRPFGLEALRLVEQRLATPEQVDRICRMAGGFPMGPFELMDLVGIDVGFEISKSFFEQSFGEPRCARRRSRPAPSPPGATAARPARAGTATRAAHLPTRSRPSRAAATGSSSSPARASSRRSSPAPRSKRAGTSPRPRTPAARSPS